ncbi:MAG: alkaline phosphatase PhoX [Pseudomonadota bacterium]
MIDRRGFLQQAGGAVAAAFGGWQQVLAQVPGTGTAHALRPDPHGILELPEGFAYTVLSRAGDEMDDGLLVPGGCDGMAAFAGASGRIVLVRNHELDAIRGPLAGTAFGRGDARLSRIRRERLYDAGGEGPAYGGTTTLVLDPGARRVERQHLSLGGTLRNCAGGATPWGSWLSCEESLQSVDARHARDHGYVFEVPARERGLVQAQPLTALGRFNHEAAAIDPESGIVYLTEDRPDGLFYRLVPHERGRLAAGGRLQALAIVDWSAADTRGWHAGAACEPGRAYRARWIDLERVEAPDDDLRQRGHASGAALFARGEGMWWGQRELFFACTSGGAAQAGQIFRYRPDADGGTLTLFVESAEPARFANADNLTVAPWGDLIVCEDADRACQLVGVRPDGSLYTLARNPYNDSELAGVCFAPDGRTLFVNVQWAGLTLAITGPFETL